MIEQSKYEWWRDPSLWVLLGLNIATIYFALSEGWNLATIMWIYWIQSVTIGVFHFVRILQLEKFTVEGVKVNGKQIPVTASEVLVKGFFATFFAIHYGLFHFVYLIFMIVGIFAPIFGTGGMPEWKEVGLVSVLFFINHLFSFVLNQKKDSHQQNIGTVMMYPYARIIPMHITIIIGAFVNALPLFLILKAVADALSHVFEHALLRKGSHSGQ
jgi:hypothetical protein